MEQITLQQIKDQYAKELGYIEWDDVDEKWLYIDEIAIRYATACCKATQENIYSGIIKVRYLPIDLSDIILSPDNIVIL